MAATTTGSHNSSGNSWQRQALFRIATAISSRLNLTQIMEMACEAVTQLCDGDHSAILLITENGKEGTVACEYGDGLHALGKVISLLDSPAEAALFGKGEPIIVEEVSDPASARYLGAVQSVLLSQNIESILIVPIQNDNRNVGSISLDFLGRTKVFSEQDIENCREIAAMVAIAIELQQAMALAQNQYLQIGGMQKAIADLLSQLDPQKVLTVAVQHAANLLQARDAGVYIHSSRRRRLRLSRVLRSPETRLDQMLSDGEGMAGTLLQTGAPFLYTPDYRVYAGRSHKFDVSPFEAVLEVPLKDGDRVVGVLFVESAAGRIYTDAEISLLRWFAEQAAAALRNAELFQIQTTRLKVLRDAMQPLMEAEETASGLETLAQAIIQCLDGAFCRILLMDDQGKSLLLKVHVVMDAAGMIMTLPVNPNPVPVVEWPSLSCVLECGDPQFLQSNDSAEIKASLEAFSHRLALAVPVQNLLLVPLKSAGRVVGLINIADLHVERDESLTEEKLDIVRTVAHQMAVIVARERRANLRNELVRLAQHLGGEKERVRLLQEALRLVTELFPGTMGVIFDQNVELATLEPVFEEKLPLGKTASRLSADDPVAGAAAQRRELVIASSTEEWPSGEKIFGVIVGGAIAAVPLQASGEVEAVLVLCDPGGQWLRPDREPEGLRVLEIFASRAASALSTSRLISADPRLVGQLTRLHPVIDYMLKAPDLKRLLHAFLTGVTAGYALGFNRAVVFLADPGGEYLVGRMAIGDAEFWDKHQTLSDFAHFVTALDAGIFPDSVFEKSVEQLRIPIQKNGDILSATFLEKRWKRLRPEEAKKLHSDFRNLFVPTTEFLVLPLMASEPVGVLVVDNKFSRAPISEIELTVLLSFAHRSAVTIQNRLALEFVVSEHDRLQPLYDASTTLFISEDFLKVADNSVKSLLHASGGCGVRAILVDECRRLKRYFFAGEVSSCDPEDIIREDEISQEVLSGHTCRFIDDCGREPDVTRLKFHRAADRAAVCVPVMVQARTIGVFWIGYSSPHHFSSEEIQALLLFGAQAGIAYDAALKFEASQLMLGAAYRRPANEDEYKELLKATLIAAQSRFDAIATTIWPFDPGSLKFVRQDLVAVGVTPELLEQFRDHEPHDHQVTYTVLEKGYIEIANIEESDEATLSGPTRELAVKAGIRSFQAIRLKSSDDDLLGVLYVSYAAPRTFTPDDRNRLETFATSVSQTLRSARLHLETHKARHAAQALAEMTALSSDDPSKLFDAISKKARDLLRCHVTALFAYDQTADRFTYPYFLDGAWERNWEGKAPNFSRESWVYSLLTLEREMIVEKVDTHPDYKNKLFARDEGIKTFVVIPLRATNRIVGLMFLNYRNYHRFTEDERANITLVAHQISIAIRNAQIYAERKSFEEFAKRLLGCLTVAEIAQAAAEQAAEMLGVEFSDVVLEESDGYYRAQGWVGWLDEEIRNIRFVKGTGSHTGLTIEQEEPVIVPDFNKETRFEVHELIRTKGIRGGMSFRLYEDGVPIGALLVHSRHSRHYSIQEQQLLAHIANETTAAMQGRRSSEKQAERRIEQTRAMVDALSAINLHSRGLEPDKIFAQILEQAARLAEFKARIATLHRYDADTGELVLEAVYPVTEQDRLRNNIGMKWSVKGGLANSGKIGVTGRAVLTREARLVDDVTKDDDFLSFTGESRSEMVIPLFDNGEVVGVINLESKEPGTFKEWHKREVEALAQMIVIVMRNARDHEELKETITRLDARTALAWITTTKNYWGHSLENSVIAVRHNLELMRQDLNKHFCNSIPEVILGELQEIEQLIKYAEDKPVTPPLSSEEGVVPVLINQLLKERVRQLQRNRNFCKGVTLEFAAEVQHSFRIKVSEEWLLRAVNLVIENAMRELQSPDTPPFRRRIEITTRPGRKRGVEISFRDYGPGIPETLRDQIFQRVIKKGKNDSGLGIGMLMVRTIIETYGGTVRLGSPPGYGAEIVMWFPQLEFANG